MINVLIMQRLIYKFFCSNSFVFFCYVTFHRCVSCWNILYDYDFVLIADINMISQLRNERM